jgi:hypothetical protein
MRPVRYAGGSDEMRAVYPDLLITNYSMLEYMLKRPNSPYRLAQKTIVGDTPIIDLGLDDRLDPGGFGFLTGTDKGEYPTISGSSRSRTSRAMASV